MSTAADILSKTILPTHLDSAEIRAQIAAEVRRRSIFSAQVARESYLKKLQEVYSRLASGEWNNAKAMEVLQRDLNALGYDATQGGFPEDIGLVSPAEQGSLQDLLSRARIKLQLETQVRQANSVAQLKAGSSPSALADYPVWKLVRIYGRRVPRNWSMRWRDAGDAVGWEGVAKAYPGPTGAPRMIALKSSPIWAAVGDGAGGYRDTLGNAFPPFAFGSGMGWLEGTAAEAKKLSLGKSDAVAASLDPGEREIAAALERLGPQFKTNLLKALAS